MTGEAGFEPEAVLMCKLIYSMTVSLDGYIAGPDA